MTDNKEYTDFDMFNAVIFSVAVTILLSFCVHGLYNKIYYDTHEVEEIDCDKTQCKILIDKEDDSREWIVAKKPWAKKE